jgi:hypothetical protein
LDDGLSDEPSISEKSEVFDENEDKFIKLLGLPKITIEGLY